ncbi:MAG TPA: RidA family protein [Deltaproteobacteria bacterium]|nr:RidA family protein [Deltaproteobacteria bacterium]
MNGKGISMITSQKAPAATGPYSQAVTAGDFLFVSGQIPLNPASATIISGGIKEQTSQALQNIQAILEQAGAGFDRVVKVEIFLKNMNDFSAMNDVYASFFSRHEMPARSAVEVSRLPRDVLIEISCIAYLGK